MTQPEKDATPIRDCILATFFATLLAQIFYDPITFLTNWSTFIQGF